MIDYKKVEKKDFTLLSSIAKRLWHLAYDNLLGSTQVEYMISKFQSTSAFESQTENEHYTYYFITYNNEKVGYVALQNSPNEERLFLSKLYLAPEIQKKGIAVKTLNFIKDKAKEWKKKAVYLTVNKANERAILVYEKFGFFKINSVVTDIGNGFVMDDFIYQLQI